MTNEEIIQKIISIFDSYEWYAGAYIVSDIKTDIVSVFGEGEINDIVVCILSELEYLEEQSNEDDLFKTGRILEDLRDLRDSLANGDVPKIITDKNLVLGKVFNTLRDRVKREELNNIIQEALGKERDSERVEEFKRQLVCLCEKFDFSLIPEDREGCFIVNAGFNSEVMSRLLEDTYYEK